MSAENVAQLLRIVRGLKYRELPHFIGRTVTVTGRQEALSNVRHALDDILPNSSAVLHPKQEWLEKALAKYGIMDLTLSAPSELINKDFEQGIQVLRKLGYYIDREERKARGTDDFGLMTDIDKDIASGNTYIRLYIRGQGVEDTGLALSGKFPSNHFPQAFVVEDACATNARDVWFLKHFYL